MVYHGRNVVYHGVEVLLLVSMLLLLAIPKSFLILIFIILVVQFCMISKGLWLHQISTCAD